jgi:colanic acid/amylovoran biosynthesis glycosyltransferase
MKIAYLTSEYPAPSHTFIRREVAALRSMGVDIDTFSIRRPTPSARLSGEDEAAAAETAYVLESVPRILGSALIEFVRAPVRTLVTFVAALRHRVPGLRAAIWACFHFLEAMQLVRLLRARKVVHLHNHFANSSAIVGMLAARHLAACVSAFGRAQVMRMVEPAEWSKLFISRCGLSTRGRPKHVEVEGRLRFCSVGRLSPEKGHVGLFEAFRAVLAAGIDADLHLVGDGPMRCELETWRSALGLDERIHFLGQLTEEEVAKTIADADVFVLSSFMEGLPVVIMEAFAAGVPVVAPGVAGIPELVVHRETGLLFPPSDWEALADAMVTMASDPGLRARLAERGRRRVAEQHEITRAVRPLLDQLASMGLVSLEREGERTGKKRRIDVLELDAEIATSPL